MLPSPLPPKTELLQRRRVYHVSPTVLVASIDQRGIDPSFANGSLKVSWWCEKQALMWAIAHVSGLKSISVDQLSIWVAPIWVGALKKAQFPGVYTCAFIVHAAQLYSAMAAFSWLTPEGEWLNG